MRPRDVIHASAEGVIKIPKACLATLSEAATRMYAFEREAHQVLRRTDLVSRSKRENVLELLTKYGFGEPH